LFDELGATQGRHVNHEILQGISPTLTLSNVERTSQLDNNGVPDGINASLKQTVAQLGGDAAIITYSRTRPVARAHAYLIGMDTHINQPARIAKLLEFAEKCWGISQDRSKFQISRAELMPLLQDMTPRIEGGCAASSVDTSELDMLLHLYDHLSFSMYQSHHEGCLRIALFRNSDKGPFDSNLDYALSLLQPVVAEIAGAQIEAHRAQRRIGILEGMLDTIVHGVIMLDQKARPFYANEVARTLIAETGALQIGNDHILRGQNADITQKLHGAIQQAIQTACGSDEIIIKLLGREGEQLLGFLTPAHGRDQNFENRAAILIIYRMKIHAASPALMKALGLLPSEQRFLSTFLDAPSLQIAAVRLALSEETARTYLKRVCAKLGVRRQVELASMMFGLAPPIRRHAIPKTVFIA
jgi:PAS domain-containing protein